MQEKVINSLKESALRQPILRIENKVFILNHGSEIQTNQGVPWKTRFIVNNYNDNNNNNNKNKVL